MTGRDILLKKLSSYAFASHELKLFLDTHPKDKDTLKKLKEYEAKYKELKMEFEDKYGLIMRKTDDTLMWSWVNDPWPWEE
ncbi:MAG: spore coat protein CotJB [Clostridia bacterium]|nr:spore coat protein CotJB [Clostridia bacterium]